MPQHVGIVGGGIVGLSTAYYLRRAGFEVTILDRGDLSDGCSFGNAGMIVPSHFVPLAAPGMIAKGIRWMFDAESPFYVHPRFSRELLSWGWKFYRHANEDHVKRSALPLSRLSLFSKKKYQELSRDLPFDFGFHERGLLMLYQETSVAHEEEEAARAANDLGIEARILDLEQIQALEPDVRVTARGGVYYPGDAHVTPHLLVNNLIAHLRREGVVIETNREVVSMVAEGKRVRAVRTPRGEVVADHWVLAAGSWSGQVARGFGLTLPMQAGKGYSFMFKNPPKNTHIPTIFLEARVAVTPMGANLRFGGTMEITGGDHSVNMNRVKGIVSSIQKYYPEMKVAMPEVKDVWHGLRPCSPDGLPYIGRTRQRDNLLVATGHSMVGLSLGPGTGQLISQLVQGITPEVDLTIFNPDRFNR